MKSYVTFIVLILTINLWACKTSPRIFLSIPKYDTSIKTKKISLRQLIDDYKNLQGEYIETTGIYYSAFEESAIYEDKINSNSKRAFWVDFSNDFVIADSTWLKISEKRGVKVTIKGRIDTASQGHLSQYLATLANTYYFLEQ
ncbi:MAG: hypothetical protein JST02_00280 [Bacteroidetes bacterium]|nr:hypothetical protein [Bacteroidota bacterium]